MSAAPLGWGGIVRLGLVQAALGSNVVLATSTLNRVMVVEIGLPAIVPGLLVGLHYAVQVVRPRMGHGSDLGGRRTPWIVGGMAALAAGAVLAAVATALMTTSVAGGIGLAIAAFLMIGAGVGASGTSLLVLLAARVAPERRPAAATIAWIMMIAGFAATAGTAGHALDPFGPLRLVEVAGAIAGLSLAVTVLAVRGIEGPPARAPVAAPTGAAGSFREALAEVWAEPQSRRFAVFVFVSMLAYSALELLLDPFAGSVFGLTPGESTKLSGTQHGGVLVGMIVVAVAGTVFAGRPLGAMRVWTTGGCVLSAVGVAGLGLAALAGPPAPLQAIVFATGCANGIFAIAAIAAMMQLVGAGRSSREGVRMGLWGGAQAIAFGLGGVLAAGASDLGRLLLGEPGLAYAAVFAGQAGLFVWAAVLAAGVFADAPGRQRRDPGRPGPEPIQTVSLAGGAAR